EMDSLQKELPEQIQARIAYDATAYIRSAISEVVQTLLETILIVVIVIFLFLGSLRSSLVPVVAIPTSLIGGIFLVQTLGFTINRSEEHTSELQSRENLVCRLLLEKRKST